MGAWGVLTTVRGRFVASAHFCISSIRLFTSAYVFDYQDDSLGAIDFVFLSLSRESTWFLFLMLSPLFFLISVH